MGGEGGEGRGGVEGRKEGAGHVNIKYKTRRDNDPLSHGTYEKERKERKGMKEEKEGRRMKRKERSRSGKLKKGEKD